MPFPPRPQLRPVPEMANSVRTGRPAADGLQDRVEAFIVNAGSVRSGAGAPRLLSDSPVSSVQPTTLPGLFIVVGRDVTTVATGP